MDPTSMILQSIETAVDNQLEHLDNLEEDDLAALRKQRLASMRAKDEERRNWSSNDHGKLTELADEKEFFEAAKRSRRMVALFYRPGSEICDIIGQHFQKLAENHMEARFIKVNAEKSPFLTQRLKIWMMPTIVHVKDQYTDKQYVGLDAFGGTAFTTETIERKLIDDDMLDPNSQDNAMGQGGLRQSDRRLMTFDDDELDWD